MRALGAVLLLAGGLLHVRLAFDAYGTPDLITVFFLNGIGSAVVAAWIAYDRRPLPAVAGIGLSVVSLAAFGLSRVGDGVLGFRATGLDPSPDAALTLAAEVAATLVLSAVLVASRAEVGSLVRQLLGRPVEP